MTAWSYSSIKTFEQCPRKYHRLKVVKDVQDKGSVATQYGQEVHKAAEDYVKSGTPIPKKFEFIKPTIDALLAIEGKTILTEKKMGIRKGNAPDTYQPCDFFAEDVWWRGIADLLIVDRKVAYLVDYKTSKNAKYADTKQLDMMAAAVFLQYPEVRKIKSALIFVVSNEFVKKTHIREEFGAYINTFADSLARLDAALESNVWNPNTGPLCRFCPVKDCEHNSEDGYGRR